MKPSIRARFTRRLGRFLGPGGTAVAFRAPAAVRRAAASAAAAVGLGVAGVDLVDTPAGPVVLEVNGSPGFKGIETATGVDVAGRVVSLAVSLVAAPGARRPAPRVRVPARTSLAAASPTLG